MDKTREVAQSYGDSFDSLVDLVANALAAAGYPSKHASAQPAASSSNTDLKDSIVGLGFYLARMEAGWSGPLPLGRSEVTGRGFLSIYAAAKRLVVLFRYAQSAGSLQGRAAVEVDGEVDTLEEAVMRPEHPGAVVEAAESIVATSLLLQDFLPEALREQVAELHELLGS